MACSHAVFVVEFHGAATFAFTVKHELVTYLRRTVDPNDHEHIAVWRLPDGWSRSAGPTQLNVNELIGESK